MADGTAAGWVEHLRKGGTTPWRKWVRDRDRAGLTGGGGRSLPGAAQLELLRRLNEVAPLPHRVDHVLGRPGPGRGPVHLRLPSHPSGPPAPRREVLRVAAGVLADLVAELPPASGRRSARRVGRRGPRRNPGAGQVPPFVIEGLPVTGAELRATLRDSGIEESRPARSRFGRRAAEPQLVVVLAGPVDTALHEAWTSRVEGGGARAWPRFVAQWSGRDRLPASAAIDATVAYWSRRTGTARVHVVTVPEEVHGDLLETVAGVLGLSEPPPAGAGRVLEGEPVRLPPATLDALRRVHAVLPFVCAEEDRPARRTALLDLVRARLADEPERPERPDVPEKHRVWLTAAGSALADRLAASGCPVHGDLGVLGSVRPATGRRVGDEEVLAAMIRMIHLVDAALRTTARSGRGGRR